MDKKREIKDEIAAYLHELSLNVKHGDKLVSPKSADEEITNFIIENQNTGLIAALFEGFTRGGHDPFLTVVHYQFKADPESCFTITFTPNGLFLQRETRTQFDAARETTRAIPIFY